MAVSIGSGLEGFTAFSRLFRTAEFDSACGGIGATSNARSGRQSSIRRKTAFQRRQTGKALANIVHVQEKAGIG
jgi:hypothetical protein